MHRYADAIFRFVKGIFIGTGFILPGVSGGALAAVFGIYERMLGFVANPVRRFRQDFFYFVPVALGGAFGLFLLSSILSFLLARYEMRLLWFFIGCIAGTMPSLWGRAGKNGRKPWHLAFSALVALAGYFVFAALIGGASGQQQTADGTAPWLIIGGLIGLGAIIPGLSTSNFLILFGLLDELTGAIKNLDWPLLAQAGVGGLLCILLFSRLMKFLFDRAYAVMYHLIFGLVIASTTMIIPSGSFSGVIVFSWLPLFPAGLLLGLGMGWMEKKYNAD